MIEISGVETQPPSEAGWYTYRFNNGFKTNLYYDGYHWKTAGGQMHRIMPGDTWHEPYGFGQKNFDLIKTVFETSKKINDGRSKIDVLAKSMEELGELSVEVMIDQDVSCKQPGKDGVIGEAIDVMICMADMIFQMHEDVPHEVLQEILEKKLAKWEQSAKS